MTTKELPGPIAFVLGGGGIRADYRHQARMVGALLERGIRPDFIVGTSGGAVQGALLAADPTPDAAARMAEFWHAAARRRRLQQVLTEFLGDVGQFEELKIPLHTCAASIERATARYFEYGPLIPALMASCATPGVLPPYRIGDEHYVDGSVVESAPISRAVGSGAQTVLVLRADDQRERALNVPRWPWRTGRVSLEIARRHHLAAELERRPEGVGVHIVDADYLNGLTVCEAVTAPVEVSAFVGGKLDRFFDLCDQNRDDEVAETDLLALGGRIAEAFGARTGSLVHQRLEHAFADFWTRIRTAAGLEAGDAKSVRREDFRGALARLTMDRAAYDEHVFPLISSLLAVADDNGDHVLNPAEVGSLLRALGVAEGDVHMFTLRLDTDDDGVVPLDELGDAFRDFFTAEDPGAVGNAILGGVQLGS
ncbi:MAG TPA: patatin-like phospholipase family protein [Actinospica sp.]|nr:patatin-like phospholipase family protein [Actinospica sp.]